MKVEEKLQKLEKSIKRYNLLTLYALMFMIAVVGVAWFLEILDPLILCVCASLCGVGISSFFLFIASKVEKTEVLQEENFQMLMEVLDNIKKDEKTE